MIPRYSRPEMTAIWSPEQKFRIWFEIEAHAADAQAELGVIPKQAAKTVWDKARNAKFDVARIDEIEAEVKHDVIAFLTHLSEIVGPEARFVHQGMTCRLMCWIPASTCNWFGHLTCCLNDLDLLLAALKKRALEQQEHADHRTQSRHSRGTDDIRSQARPGLCRVCPLQGTARVCPQGGRHLRDFRCGRQLLPISIRPSRHMWQSPWGWRLNRFQHR